MNNTGGSFEWSRRAARTREQPISYLMQAAVENPGLISLAAGLVDYATLPAAESARLMHRVLGDPSRARAALQYGTTAGLVELRQSLLEHMAGLDGLPAGSMPASRDDVVVSTGSQQLLFTITDALVDEGDIVITERPTYFVYTGVLKTLGADVRTVEVDAHGMVPESLDALLAEIARQGKLGRVKIVYTCDYHQNPTGLTLHEDRRPVVLDIVRRYSAEHRILLLEDAAYRELTYEGAAPRSIKSYDRDNQFVALLQTFSKPFAPGFKTGYGLLPRDLVEPVLLQKGNHDFGSTNIAQHVLLEAMRSGVYAQHVAALCRRYAEKRNAMLEALDEHMRGLGAKWTRPTGGLYVWLELPPGFDTSREGALFSRAIAEGVLYVPGAYCYPDSGTRPAPLNTMRLSFGVSEIPQILEGIKRLARAVCA